MVTGTSARILAFAAVVLACLVACSSHPAQADHVVTKVEHLQFQEGLRCRREHDFEEALNCRLPLAGTGIAEAQYNVGRIYACAEGVAENYVEAYAWFILSARNGRLDARKAQDELKPHMSPEERSHATLSGRANPKPFPNGPAANRDQPPGTSLAAV